MQNEKYHKTHDLESARRKYSELYDFAPVGYFTFDKNGRVHEANLTGAGMLGIERRLLINKPLSSFIEACSQDVFQMHCIDVFKEKTKMTCEIELKGSNGSAFYAQLQSMAVGSRYFRTILSDITERKRIENKLREAELRYRTLFEQSPDGVLIIDPETALPLEFNTIASSQLEYSREEFSKLRIFDYEAVETEDEVKRSIGKVLQTGRDEFEVHHRTKSGEVRNVLVITQTMPLEGRIVFHTIFRDITEQKKAEEALKDSREQLRNLSAHLQTVREDERIRISREIHDELGQILTALKMDISWLGNKCYDHQSVREKTTSMLKIIDTAFKTMKRIAAELRPRILDDLGIASALEWLAEDFQERTGIACDLIVRPKDMTLDKDRSTAIFRIFQETMTNVLRHAKANRVRASLERIDGEAVLTVKDNGRGITEEQLSHPQSFGLIGMKERAVSFGGRLQIRGIPEKGTTITVNIPLWSSA